ncbi:MAG: hypothetical protein KDA81_02625 [Planctomycetaceae bacterium]|nr:hypothetical protein [Planctomycetaceae bacterium]
MSVLTVEAFAAASSADDLAQQAFGILQQRCYKCHGAEKQTERMEALAHNIMLEDAGDETYVVPGDLKASYLWVRVGIEKDMPPKKHLPEGMPAEEIEVLRNWILEGAPAWKGSHERPFITEIDVLNSIANHLFNSGDASTRKFVRYFSITHLYNNPNVSDRDLRLYRAALSKSLNSMSRGSVIVVPTAVNEQQTIYSVDLRKLGWQDLLLWEEVVGRYPYGLKPIDLRQRQYFDKVAELYGEVAFDGFPYVRADWFIVTATRPPIYHKLLDIPEDLKDLYSRLKIDPEENFQIETAQRAGMFESGVSGQNRLVEYHNGGAFWISYDFKSDAGRSNLALFPLGPKFEGNDFNKFAFEHDGGEIIWELDNGMHGYMLVKGTGERIDDGPVEIVFDKNHTSGSPLIVNGISCIACHKKGMQPLVDDIRNGHALRFNNEAAQKVERLYPPAAQMTRVMDETNEKFYSALKKAIGPFFDPDTDLLKLPEPVSFVATEYDKNVDIIAASRELGFEREDDLRLQLSGRNIQQLGLGPLSEPKGTVKRAFWESAESGISIYQKAANEVGFGSAAIGAGF